MNEITSEYKLFVSLNINQSLILLELRVWLLDGELHYLRPPISEELTETGLGSSSHH